MPSPVEDRPGLMIRDSYGYSDATLILPPSVVPFLQFFDGETEENELSAYLVRETGDIAITKVKDQIWESLSKAAFLEDEVYEKAREEKHKAFAESPVKTASHAGGAYPDTPEELRTVFNQYMTGVGAKTFGQVRGIAAPHVSPFGGYDSYRAAYSALRPALDMDRTFILLGTSHYGDASKFGLTRKNYVTPYGAAETQTALVDELFAKAPGAVVMEDYCHSFEHSLEFQTVFLQHLLGPRVRILPVLVGSFAVEIAEGRLPESNQDTARFFDALGEIGTRLGSKACWVMGVDMAHMGQRYGDETAARANEAEMTHVAEMDKARMEKICASNASDYWSLVAEGGEDQLKWCGSAPFYTFLKSAPGLKGNMEHYEQWNIDETSIVSFAGMTFV